MPVPRAAVSIAQRPRSVLGNSLTNLDTSSTSGGEHQMLGNFPNKFQTSFE